MDTEKVEKARNGNVDEIGNLLMENMKSMYRVAFSILKTEEEISDAISNTTVIVFEKIHTLKKAEYFKTWMIRILINECNQILRHYQKIQFPGEIQEGTDSDMSLAEFEFKEMLELVD